LLTPVYSIILRANAAEGVQGESRLKDFQVVPETPLVKVKSDNNQFVEVFFAKVSGADHYVVAMFDYQMNPVSGIDDFGSIPSDHSGHLKFDKNLLHAGKTYKIAIGAINNGGTSSPRLVDFMVPPAPVVIENIMDIDGNVAVIWYPSVGSTRYQVKFFMVKSEETPKETFLTSDLRIVTNLSSQLAYRIELRAYNSGGYSSVTTGK
jgi:hypothetical protein